MTKLLDAMQLLPKMLCGDELLSSLTVLPEYDENIICQPASQRLIALSDLYSIYLPSSMSTEIYSKLYLALIRSLQKKSMKEAVVQQNENYKTIRQKECNSILGGSDSFTIIGTSGIGKSSAINRAIDLIMKNGIIEISDPFTKIIPCVVVQCPFDSSIKGLLLEILRKVDEVLNTVYYKNAVKARATNDMLIGSVSQVALNHIGLLVVDEIQNVVNNKHGKSLIAMLTQLINNSGISICMVGTPESANFFEQAMQLARRSIGLQYTKLNYDNYFYNFCKTLFHYQYVENSTKINDGIIEWLYEHSSGIISVVVSLIHDAQEIAILNGSEILNVHNLTEAYQTRLALLHPHIQIDNKKIKKSKQAKKEQTPIDEAIVNIKKESNIINCDKPNISDLILTAKENNFDIIATLKEYITIEEVII